MVPPTKMSGFAACNWYRCVSAGALSVPGAKSAGTGPRPDVDFPFGKLAKVAAGTPKFRASTSGGVCPTQSLIENVPNSEKWPLSNTRMKVQVPGPRPWIECPCPREEPHVARPEVHYLVLIVGIDRLDAAAPVDHVGPFRGVGMPMGSSRRAPAPASCRRRRVSPTPGTARRSLPSPYHRRIGVSAAPRAETGKREGPARPEAAVRAQRAAAPFRPRLRHLRQIHSPPRLRSVHGAINPSCWPPSMP